MIRALAVTVLMTFAPLAARAQSLTLVYDAPKSAPESYDKLVWSYKDQLSIGYWYSEKQVLKIKTRIDFLEEKAAKECVDEQIKNASPGFPTWVWITAGIVVGGFAGWWFKGYWERSHPPY